MSYYESAEGVQITRERALQELEKHGVLLDVDLFFEECGRRETYDAQEVLQWLGY
jgi:hypothetical protein